TRSTQWPAESATRRSSPSPRPLRDSSECLQVSTDVEYPRRRLSIKQRVHDIGRLESRTYGEFMSKIAVYGAYGFTGGLVVAELRRRGIPAVLVGRSAERLEPLGCDVRVAPLDDPQRLAEAFADCDAVINAAGPFTPTSSVVIRA